MRTSPTITDAEVQIYANFCAEHAIITDNSQDGIANANFIRDYFLNEWNADITEANLAEALKQIRPHLKFYNENHLAFSKLFYALSPAEQEAFKAWKWPFGLKQNEYNAAVLLTRIASHKFRVTEQNLSLATGQAKVAPLLQWDESARLRYANPKQHSDDGEPFLGKNVNEPLWRRRQREREEREAANKPAEQTRQADAWQSLCEQMLRDGTHSQQAAMRAQFDHAVAAGKSYREIHSELNRLRASYKSLVPASKF